jgi:hypothetical protein
MLSLTHKNLPLAIFLEKADLGYSAWSGSTTQKVIIPISFQPSASVLCVLTT